MDRPFNVDDLRNSHLEEPPERDREISLGTSTILGIFFGLALVCALFFALGYSMGRRSVPPTIVFPLPMELMNLFNRSFIPNIAGTKEGKD